jgi:hypothetical protein
MDPCGGGRSARPRPPRPSSRSATGGARVDGLPAADPAIRLRRAAPCGAVIHCCVRGGPRNRISPVGAGRMRAWICGWQWGSGAERRTGRALDRCPPARRSRNARSAHQGRAGDSQDDGQSATVAGSVASRFCYGFVQAKFTPRPNTVAEAGGIGTLCIAAEDGFPRAFHVHLRDVSRRGTLGRTAASRRGAETRRRDRGDARRLRSSCHAAGHSLSQFSTSPHASA